MMLVKGLQRFIVDLVVAAMFLSTNAAVAEDTAGHAPWSVTVYSGPWSQKYFGAVLQDFNLQSRAVFVGGAAAYKGIYLGQDIWLSGELQTTHTFVGHANTTFAAGLGFEFDKLFGYDRTSFSIFTGPSYALNPDSYVIGYKGRRYPAAGKALLNEVSMELASGIPTTQNWDWVVRLYHRSGAFGLYSINDDEGLGVGVGVKLHFGSD